MADPVTVTDLRTQLMRDELYRRYAYRDARGILTVGFGRNLEQKGVALREAEFLLDNDITDATADVVRTIPVAQVLDELRRGVLVNMTFNLGLGGLLEFHRFLEALTRHDYRAAKVEMLDSEWRRQVGDRAERLADQMEAGDRWH